MMFVSLTSFISAREARENDMMFTMRTMAPPLAGLARMMEW